MSDVTLPGPVLGLTAAGASAVALIAPDAADRRSSAPGERFHVESLIPLAAELVAEAGLTASDIAAVAVGRGPAPYTGLRIALATARTLGYALGVPVWGVSDLDALAQAAAERFQLGAGATVVAALDAKRREVYWARYRVERPRDADALDRVEGPAVTAPTLAPAAPGGAVVGPSTRALKGQTPAEVDPAVLARLAAVRAARGLDVSAEPLYLRRPHTQPPGPAKRASR